MGPCPRRLLLSSSLCERRRHAQQPGNYTVQGTAPTWGVYYNDGINPHIALNNRNEVVEVHQVPGENLLHYWRGKVVNSTIQFVSSQRYNDNASQPAVTHLDNGTVVEAHVKDVAEIIVTTGMLSANDPALIEWGSSVGIGWNSVNDINYPALATAGTEVVVTFEEGMSALKYALGKILLQYERYTRQGIQRQSLCCFESVSILDSRSSHV